MAVKLYTPDANVIVHETKVDFRRRVVQRQINLVQYDKSMPVIAVQLCSNGNEYVLPENASAYIRFGKRDHTYVYNECLGCDQTRTIVYFAITDQMTVFYGEHTPIVELRIGDTVAGSGSIPIWIDRNPIQNGDTESKSDLSVFEKAIEAAKKITDLGIGKSVPPTLILTDLSGDEPVTKSFLTEEEKTNLEKGLYNQVFYIDTSIGMPNMHFSNYFPEIYNAEAGGFFIYAGTLDTKAGENLPTVNPTHIYGYNIEIAEKDSSGNYPITITRAIELPLSRQGGGGASVSPCLNLLDQETQGIRTSITEEEKNNLDKGLYNSVLYFDESAEPFGFISTFFPEPLANTEFSIFNLTADEATQKITITGSSVYHIEVFNKNEDGTYPISIQKIEELESYFGGGGGGAIQEIEAIKSTGGRSRDNQYTLSSTPTSSMFIMKVKNDDGYYIRFTMILQSSLDESEQIYFGCKVGSLSDLNTCVYAYSEGTTAILSNQCYLPPEIKSGDLGKVLVARNYGYNLEDLPSSLPNISQSDIGKYLVVGNNQEASWQNLPESTSTIIRRW